MIQMKLTLEKPNEFLKIEKGDLGDEGFEPRSEDLVLHLNLGVILRLSITEE